MLGALCLFVYFGATDRLNLDATHLTSRLHQSQPHLHLCLFFHPSHSSASPEPTLNVCQGESEWAPAWRYAQPFPFLFPAEALLPVARHNWALIPGEALCGFSGSRKLITAINCEHQQSAPGPAVSPRLRSPRKVLIQGEGRAQAVAEFTTSRLSITLTAQ